MSNYTTPRKRNFGKIFLTILVLFVIFMLALLFTGCSTPASSTTDPQASQAAAPEEEPAVETPSNPVFGDTITFDDGVSISVSAPAAYDPSDTAVTGAAGTSPVAFEIVVTNNSTENFDPVLVYATASSGGVEADGIFDSEKNVGFPPTTAILPGKTIKWTQAFAVADPADITLELSAGFSYDSIIFTNK